MAGLGKETAAYERMRDMLETDHLNERVVVYDEKLVGTCESFEAAAEDAIRALRSRAIFDQTGRGTAADAAGISTVSTGPCRALNPPPIAHPRAGPGLG